MCSKSPKDALPDCELDPDMDSLAQLGRALKIDEDEIKVVNVGMLFTNKQTAHRLLAPQGAWKFDGCGVGGNAVVVVEGLKKVADEDGYTILTRLVSVTSKATPVLLPIEQQGHGCKLVKASESTPHATEEQMQEVEQQVSRQREENVQSSNPPTQTAGFDVGAQTENLGSITCASVAGLTVPCRVPQGARAVFSRQLSKTSCIAGRNYRIDPDAVYVTGGCRASFALLSNTSMKGGAGEVGVKGGTPAGGPGVVARVHYSDIFRINPDGSVSPKVPVSVGGISMSGNVTFTRGVSFNGIDIASMQGHDVKAIQHADFVEIVDFYP